MVIDNDGKVTVWNSALESMTGVKSSDMVGKGDHEYSIPFYGERRSILIDRVFDTREEIQENYQHIHYENGILSAEAFVPKSVKRE
jgi:PAS domain-containing protein